MKKNIFPVAIFCAMFSFTASAEQWYLVHITPDKTHATMVDADSLECNGVTCSNVMATVNAAPDRPYDLSYIKYKFDCEKEIHAIEYISFYTNGKYDNGYNNFEGWEPVKYGTPVEYAMNFACGRVKPDPRDAYRGSMFKAVRGIQRGLRDSMNRR